MDGNSDKAPTSYVVSARVSPRAKEWLDAYAQHILADSMGTEQNRSAAIKACFELTTAALSPSRLDALREIRRKLNLSMEDALSRVIDEGVAALSRPAARDRR